MSETPTNPGPETSHGLQRVKLAIVRVLEGVDVIVYTLVAFAFFIAALLALAYSILNLINGTAFDPFRTFDLTQFVQSVLGFVSDLLLILIIMEVLSTIRSYLVNSDDTVRPFLYIGIISATRGILSIGARLSIAGTSLTPDEFRNAMIELGVNAAVIIALGLTLRVLGYATNRGDRQRRRGIPPAILDAPAKPVSPPGE